MSPSEALRRINRRWRAGDFINGLDPNFGYETAGSSSTIIAASDMWGSVFTAPADVDVANSLTFRAKATFGTPLVKGVLVQHSDLTIVDIGAALQVTTALKWYTSTFSTPPSLTPGAAYVLMIIPQTSIFFYYDAGDTNQGHYDYSNSYASPQDPTDAAHNDNKYSIYCSYTAAVVAKRVVGDGLSCVVA